MAAGDENPFCRRRRIGSADCGGTSLMLLLQSKRVLPGFGLSLGSSLLFVCLILLLPLSALVMQLSQMTWLQYWQVVTAPQLLAAYEITLLSAGTAALFNGAFGLLMAWILKR